MKRAILIVLAIAGLAFGQATQPATQPAAPSLEDLKASMASLQRQNAKLALENADLKKQVAAMKAERDKMADEVKKLTPPPPTDKVAEAIAAGRPAVGMTLEQVRKATQDEGEAVSEDQFGATYRFRREAYRWSGGVGGTMKPVAAYYMVTFRGNKAVSVSQ